MNRGKKKEGTFKILIPAKTRLPTNQSLKIDVLYSFYKSEISKQETDLDEMNTTGLKFKIGKDDCLVLRFSPKEIV